MRSDCLCCADLGVAGQPIKGLETGGLPQMRFEAYQTGSFYDEMFEPGGQPRAGAAMLVQKIEALSLHEIKNCQQAAELALLNMGITFNVYGHEAGTEKVWPF